jgi:integrase
MPNPQLEIFDDLPPARPTATATDVGELSWRARAPKTRDAYERDFLHVQTWCESQGLPTFPLTEESVARYLTAHKTTGIPTLRRRLFAITFIHRAQSVATPVHCASVRLVWSGLLASNPHAPEQSLPLGLPEVLRILAAIDAEAASAPRASAVQRKALRDRAMVLCDFAAAMKIGELCSMHTDALRPIEGGIETRVRSGARRTRLVQIYAGEQGSDPVSALRGWVDLAGPGPVFRAVDRHGNIATLPLTTSGATDIFRRRYALAGFDYDAYSPHALRIGALEEAARRGAETHDIVTKLAGLRQPDTVAANIARAKRGERHPARLLGL